MRKVLSFIFFLFATVYVFAQTTANIQFVNPEIIGSKYRITFRIVRAAGQTWNLGGGSYSLNYPHTIIQNPVIVNNLHVSPSFSATTTQGSNFSTGTLRLNPTYASGTAGLTFPASNELDVLTIEWDILNLAGVTTLGNQLVWRYPSTAFANPRLAVTTATPINAITFTTFLPQNPLPIELLSFTGKAQGEVNSFRWDVASQVNVSHFVVERSTDGVNNFREVTERIKAAGTTNIQMTYTAEDKNPISLGYYRMKSVDFDGTTSYSNVVTIDRRNTKFGVIDLSPNPTNDVVRINFESNTRGNIDFTVTDVTGRIVKTQSSFATLGNNSFVIDMTDLTSGTYFVSMTDGKNTSVEKVVKQ